MFHYCEIVKVLHLIDSSGMYGAERVVITLLDELKKSNFKGILGCIRRYDTEIPLIAIEAQRIGIEIVFFTMKRGFSTSGILQINRYIKRNSIRIVHCHGYKPNVYLSLIPHCGVKVLTTVHGWAKQNVGLLGRCYEYFDSIALKRMDRVVAVSNAVVSDISKKNVKNSKISIVYNGIKVDGFGAQVGGNVIRKKFGIPENAFVIGAVGRLAAVKGYHFMLDAMDAVIKKIPECKLIVAGDGPLKEELSCEIYNRKLQSYVSLIGYQDHNSRFLTMVDLFIMASLTEGLPMALLEAMAYGKPILATEVGGIPEVVSNGLNGILVPHSDSNAIAGAIVKLFYDKGKRDEIGERGRSSIQEKFTSGRMADKNLSIYSGLVV